MGGIYGAKKNGTYGFLDLAKDVISMEGNKPLAAQEIWDKATDKQKEKLDTKAQNPVQNIYASIYQFIKNNSDSELIPYGRNPVKWKLKEKDESIVPEDEFDAEDDDTNDEESVDESGSFNERDLHPILVSYVGDDPYFASCYCKTIMHEKSNRKKKGLNRWIHPDIVGVSYPFGIGGYDKPTLDFMSTLEHTECRLYSFEMKKQIKAANLREWYFEAVSNSSWAHEGYLVALDYEPGIEGEMKMLNESFGIGFIKLNAEDYTKSIRLFTARRKDELDWNMVNRLLSENADFKKFIETIKSDLSASSVRNKKDFDEQFETSEAALEYAQGKKIKI